MSTIDWSKPIEAVRHSDGKVIPMVFVSCSALDTYDTETAPDDQESNEQWHADGSDWCSSAKWFIRNVEQVSDPVNHPPHYTSHPSGVECITVTEHMGFNLGNAVKYIWRADLKLDAIEDLRKARWYLDREIERRSNAG